MEDLVQKQMEIESLRKEEEYREYQFLSKDLDYAKERENVK